MRVLGIVTYPYDRVPGQRFRIEQWQPLLERDHGIHIEFRPFFHASEYELIRRRGHTGRKVAATVAGTARRLRDALDVGGCDALYVYREAAPVGPAFFERLMAWRVPYVLDFDDAIFLPQVSDANRSFGFVKSHRKFGSVSRLAAHVIAGNDYLAGHARQFNSHVTVVPTTIDTDRYVPRPPHEANPPVVGWTGSATTLEYALELRDVFAELAQTQPFRLRIIGDAPSYPPIPGVEVENVTWTAAKETEDLAPLDVGIMPLRADEWSRGKCGAKALQYMALGIPAVCSPVGVNSDIVQHGVNGFLASTHDEWVARLRELLASPELRRRMGREARETVVARYSARAWAPKVAEVFRSVAAARRTAGR